MFRSIVCFLLLLTGSTRAGILADDIRQQYLPSEYETVLAGEEDIPVFSAQPTTTLSRGVAIIFMDTGYQGLTLQNAQQLAARLNQWGWHTRIVPSPVSLNPPATTPSAETVAPADGTGSDKVQSDSDTLSALMHPRAWAGTPVADAGTSQTMMALIAGAVFRSVDDVPGFRLVISQGMGAAQFLSLAVTDNVPPPDGLVVISPYWPQSGLQQNISEQLASTLFPVLDLQLPGSTPWTAGAPAIRRTDATKALKLHYRQKQLGASVNLASTFGNSAFSNSLSKEIYGWVNYLGW